MSARHQLQSIVDLRKVKFTGIDLRDNVFFLNNLGNCIQLCPISPHKQKPVRLSLPFGFPVVFCACQREQEPLDKGKTIFLRKCPVRDAAPAERSASFARAFPETMTRRPIAFAMGTAICPKLPEPPGMKRVCPGFAHSSSVSA